MSESQRRSSSEFGGQARAPVLHSFRQKRNVRPAESIAGLIWMRCVVFGPVTYTAVADDFNGTYLPSTVMARFLAMAKPTPALAEPMIATWRPARASD